MKAGKLSFFPHSSAALCGTTIKVFNKPPPDTPERTHHGTHSSSSSLPDGCAGTPYFEGNARISLRQAPPGVCDQSKQSDQRYRIRKCIVGGHYQEIVR